MLIEARLPQSPCTKTKTFLPNPAKRRDFASQSGRKMESWTAHGCRDRQKLAHSSRINSSYIMYI